MEPKLPAPNFGPEQGPANYGQSREYAPQPPTPETGLERGHEQLEQRAEAAPAMAAPVLPPPVAAPAPPVPVQDDTSVAQQDTVPLVANDDDLIEREWVKKAKEIIVETKDDPYRREQEVGKLQVDYLRKRYGKELGASS